MSWTLDFIGFMDICSWSVRDEWESYAFGDFAVRRRSHGYPPKHRSYGPARAVALRAPGRGLEGDAYLAALYHRRGSPHRGEWPSGSARRGDRNAVAVTDVSDRSRLLTFLTALGASPKALHRPVCRGWVGDWQISGKHGHILTDGTGYYLYATTPEIDRTDPDGKRRCYGSTRRWGNIRVQLGTFMVLTQEGGDDEGIYRLDRLPTEIEAGVIRECLGIRKRRHLSAEEMARSRSTLAIARGLAKSPLRANSSLESTGEPLPCPEET